VVFSLDGTQIVSGSGDRTAWVWHVKMCDCVKTVDTGVVTDDVVFEPDGSHIRTTSSMLLQALVLQLVLLKGASAASHPDDISDSSSGDCREDGFCSESGPVHSYDRSPGSGGNFGMTLAWISSRPCGTEIAFYDCQPSSDWPAPP